MTTNELQAKIIKEIEAITIDMSFVNVRGEPDQIKGYKQAIPYLPAFSAVPLMTTEPKDIEIEDIAEDEVFPYFVVRVDNIEYQKKVEDRIANQACIMIVFAIIDPDPEMQGYTTLASVMERVTERFQKNTALGPFFCEKKMNLAFGEDDTYPYFFGGIEMIWNLPEIELEEN